MPRRTPLFCGPLKFSKQRIDHERMERDFQSELIRGSRARGFHVVPIPDSGGPFGGKKVYDLGIGRDSVFYAVELKWESGNAMSFSKLEAHQRKNLTDAREKGFIPLVICQFERWDRTPAGRRRCLAREVHSVALETLLRASHELRRKSVPLDWWQRMGTELPRFKTPGFDKNGEPAFDKKGKRKMVYAYDFSPVHEGVIGRWKLEWVER